MCKADISLNTYDWVDNNKRPLTNFHTEHSCYNWDLVNDWARHHSFDMYDNTSLVHPFLGKSALPSQSWRKLDMLTLDTPSGQANLTLSTRRATPSLQKRRILSRATRSHHCRFKTGAWPCRALGRVIWKQGAVPIAA